MALTLLRRTASTTSCASCSQRLEWALASWMGLPPSLCIFAKTCGNALALEHNGDLHSCNHFVEPKFLLGNIKEQHLVTTGRV